MQAKQKNPQVGLLFSAILNPESNCCFSVEKGWIL